MSKKWSKILLSLVSICLILSMSVSPAMAVEDETDEPNDAVVTSNTTRAKKGGKQEVVYANLAADGTLSDVYIVNEFEVDSAGTITDYGNYSSLVNLTNTDEISSSGDTVTASANEGSFYYQGTLKDAALPWFFSVSYYLDGVKMSSDEIAGKSGALEIRISSKKNSGVDPVFCDNYMLQVSVTLDGEKNSAILSENATIANAGKNKMISHTVMPGSDADILISATVQDFSMGSIEIAAVPFSMPIEIPDTGEFAEEMGTFSDSMVTFKNGIGSIADGSQEFLDGMNMLSGNSKAIVDGSSQINAALTQLSNSLSGSSGDLDLTSLAALPASLRTISGGLGNASSNLRLTKDEYDSIFSSLGLMMGNIPSVDQSNIDALYASVSSDPSLKGCLDELVGSYTAAQAAKKDYVTYQSEAAVFSGGLDTLATSVDGIAAGLNTMADQIETALNSSDLMAGLMQLKEGMAQLSSKYKEFHAGLSTYMDGVGQSATGYAELDKGIDQVYDGAKKMSAAVATLPDTIQDEIDKLLADYDTSDFEPISFASPKNTDVSYVQFVIMTKPITKAQIAQEETPATEETLWDRIANLFS